MKVFCLAPQENWVCDRFEYEWSAINQDLSVKDPNEADIIWLLADWCWERIPTHVLESKKVICTVHHIVPEKFDNSKFLNFKERDKFVNLYHVPSRKTFDQVVKLTDREIFCQPFWVNQAIWKKLENKKDIRKKYNLPCDSFIVGSFQRDTEGFDLVSPKLEKGPDIFIKYVKKLREQKDYIHVLLAGWRRQYVIEELNKAAIPFTFIQLPSFSMLNELYNCLDLYVVGSRYEGGPQSIFECAAMKVPIVSTSVGSAPEILDDRSIFDLSCNSLAIPDIEIANKNVEKYLLPQGMLEFRKMMSYIYQK